jgi:Family of unknown function (DUF6941)
MRVGGQALLTCDATAADPSGKITLYGIFDRIFAQGFPTVHNIFAIYWRCVAPGPGRAGVTVIRPDGSTLVELEPAETNREGLHYMQGTYTLGAFEFPVDGEYTLVLKHNGVEMIQANLVLERRDQR